jgi:hypothetical protein
MRCWNPGRLPNDYGRPGMQRMRPTPLLVSNRGIQSRKICIIITKKNPLPKSMSILTRFGFLARLSINKSKSTWHILHIFASHYMHAYFPRLNTPNALLRYCSASTPQKNSTNASFAWKRSWRRPVSSSFLASTMSFASRA